MFILGEGLMPVIRVGQEIVAQCAIWRSPGLEGKKERGETCGFTFFASLYFRLWRA